VCHDLKVGKKKERADNSPREETAGRRCILVDIFRHYFVRRLWHQENMRSPLGDDMGMGAGR